ncbi:response regulator transcription factor [Butyrivibrio sp. AE2032]|uniref:response regulator transcription factor n=1 Tax=Butyrivibrio sp. AE2032 TaxID=1458463 RepID=UPI00054EB075|nr:response regulator [Butyrivibrio sp. AE2032]
MLKVMLVDDEPYILQGLQVIIDWEGEGFEIAAVCSNGKEALRYLTENHVDLVISDIRMPEMTGLELLETVKKDKVTDAEFVLLTGYDDFAYTQKAIRYGCCDYILKPVEEEELISVLRKVSNRNQESIVLRKDREKMEDAYLARVIRHLVKGKFTGEEVDYINKHVQISGSLRFIYIELINREAGVDEEDPDDMSVIQRQLFNACREILKEYANNFTMDISYDEENYNIGFIYCETMAEMRDMNETEFLNAFIRKIELLIMKPVRMLCGQLVQNISDLALSYVTCRRLKSITGFHNTKKLYFYEETEENQGAVRGFVLCKNTIDEIIDSIVKNDPALIESGVEKLYEELRGKEGNNRAFDLNINYLLFQLIHLASELDDTVNQEEIIQYISDRASEGVFLRGSHQHLKKFALEYASYLAELRKSISHGILAEVEAEIRENFAENISLKDLGDKYHINSSYLGQIFRKKYGMSFKNYLTNYRIKEAARQIITTDEKINRIAENVGYKDSDYFIRKFIEIMGCTPSKYRKTNRGA